MTQTVQLKFNGVTAEIKPVVDGMYDLNDIWRTFKLPEKKRPHQWRGRERDNLTRTANLRVGHVQVNEQGHRLNMTLATKKALFMYAAWCDYEFHDVVFSVFQLVAEGKTDEASALSSKVITIRNGLKRKFRGDMDMVCIWQATDIKSIH